MNESRWLNTSSLHLVANQVHPCRTQTDQQVPTQHSAGSVDLQSGGACLARRKSARPHQPSHPVRFLHLSYNLGLNHLSSGLSFTADPLTSFAPIHARTQNSSSPAARVGSINAQALTSAHAWCASPRQSCSPYPPDRSGRQIASDIASPSLPDTRHTR